MSLLMDAPPVLGVLEDLEARVAGPLTVGEAADVLRGVVRVHGRAEAVFALALAVFTAGNGPRAAGATDAASWLAANTKTSGREASRSARRARVIEALPGLGDALSAGEISPAHVDVVAGIVPEKLWAKATSLVAAARSSSPEQLEQAAHQLVIDSDGDGGAKRAARLAAQRQVRFFSRDSGMRAMLGEWPPEETAPIERAVDLVADQLWRAQHPDRKPTVADERTLKFRRAEAVSEIARRVLSGTEAVDPTAPEPVVDDEADTVVAAKPPIVSKRVTAAKPRPSVPSLSVLIDFQTLTGVLAANGICELFDGTPISPDTVRRLACDAAIIPMVLGSRGEVLNQGRRIYAPTMAQRHAVAIRDRHCAFPGCRRPAKWTDVVLVRRSRT
jgi:hypothetical protein